MFLGSIKSTYKNVLTPLFFLFLAPNLYAAIDNANIKKITDYDQTNEITNTNLNKFKSEYILGSGDLLSIKFPGFKEYSDLFLINQDGLIILPEIGEYYASGKTLFELKKDLEKKFDNYLFNPELIITISLHRPASIILKGAINRPGLYTIKSRYFSIENKSTNEIVPFQNKTPDFFIEQRRDLKNSEKSILPTLFEVLKRGEGFTNEANLSKIKIIRNYPDIKGGGKITTNLNLLSILENGDQTQNIDIFDGDTIIVEKSNLNIRDQILAINRSNFTPNKVNIFVTGNVYNPGAKILKQGATLNQGIASAGGKKKFSGNVEFIRFDNNGINTKLTFKYDQNALAGSKKNPILLEGDIININLSAFGKATGLIQDVATPALTTYSLYSIFDN